MDPVSRGNHFLDQTPQNNPEPETPRNVPLICGSSLWKTLCLVANAMEAVFEASQAGDETKTKDS